MKLLKIRDISAIGWGTVALHGAFLVFLMGLLAWKLGSIPGGYAAPELATHHLGQSFKVLLENPLNAPYLVFIRALAFLNLDSLLAQRILSAGLGGVTIGAFYFLIRHWHGARTAFFGTLLFGSSALFLHITRLGTPEVLALLFFLLIATGFWLKQTQSRWALLISFILMVTLLYVPGMIVLLVLGALWQWRTIDAVFKKHLSIVSLGGLLFALALVPLGWAFYRNPALAKVWAGLPANGWPEPLTVLKELAEVPLAFFIRSSSDPLHWLGTVPLLDMFTIVMFLLGGYLYWRYISLSRSKLFIAVFLTTALLISLKGGVSLILLLPFVYLIVAAGIHHLLAEWFAVFPRNPIARGVGITVLGITILFAVTYHTRHYFVAWPGANATQQVFTIPNQK